MGSHQGQFEISQALSEVRRLIRVAIVFSVFVNLLMLTSPLFMLQVYDRVLGSQSEETLAALVLLMSGLFAVMAVLDLTRAQVMGRVAARVQARLEPRVFDASLRSAAEGTGTPQAPLAELDAMTRFLASPGFLALVDLPWVPVFLAATALFHPMLGLLALGGGAVLVLVTYLNQRGTGAGLVQISREARLAEHLSERLHSEAELVRALGMSDAAQARWHAHRDRQAKAALQTADAAAMWSTTGRTFRQYLQSAILALAALLVLRAEVTAGAMVASSILTGRALAPVDQLLAHWPALIRARSGRKTLALLLERMPPLPERLPLPRPAARLALSGLTVTLAGSPRPGLAGIEAQLAGGQALAVIGASGSGKTTLARCLTGVLPLTPEMALLGGAPLAAYGRDLGHHIGYLPQKVQLFDGTIAENIARLALKPAAEALIEAARRADIHETILALPQGYETPISARAPQLSGGQIQRLGLARALYGHPVLVVLDEPDSNLDHEGSEALSRAVRQLKAEGAMVVIMAHRPAAIRDCDLMLVLEAGQRRAFGPAQEVLRAMFRQMPAAPDPARTDDFRTAAEAAGS